MHKESTDVGTLRQGCVADDQNLLCGSERSVMTKSGDGSNLMPLSYTVELSSLICSVATLAMYNSSFGSVIWSVHDKATTSSK